MMRQPFGPHLGLIAHNYLSTVFLMHICTIPAEPIFTGIQVLTLSEH